MSTQPFDDATFPLLAPETEPPDADELLALQDGLLDPDTDDDGVEQDPPVPLGRTPAYDYAQRRHVPSLAGGPLMLYGLDTVRQWTEKCLRTRRGDNAACHPDFGVDALLMDLIDGGDLDTSAVAEYQGMVERALPVHPAIRSIDGFSIEQVDDVAIVRFAVTLKDDGEDPLDIEIGLETARG